MEELIYRNKGLIARRLIKASLVASLFILIPAVESSAPAIVPTMSNTEGAVVCNADHQAAEKFIDCLAVKFPALGDAEVRGVIRLSKQRSARSPGHLVTLSFERTCREAFDGMDRENRQAGGRGLAGRRPPRVIRDHFTAVLLGDKNAPMQMQFHCPPGAENRTFLKLLDQSLVAEVAPDWVDLANFDLVNSTSAINWRRWDFAYSVEALEKKGLISQATKLRQLCETGGHFECARENSEDLGSTNVESEVTAQATPETESSPVRDLRANRDEDQKAPVTDSSAIERLSRERLSKLKAMVNAEPMPSDRRVSPQLSSPESSRSCAPTSYRLDRGRRLASISCGLDLQVSREDSEGGSTEVRFVIKNHTESDQVIDLNLVESADPRIDLLTFEEHEQALRRKARTQNFVTGLSSVIGAAASGYGSVERTTTTGTVRGRVNGSRISGRYSETSFSNRDNSEELEAISSEAESEMANTTSEFASAQALAEDFYLRPHTLAPGESVERFVVLRSSRRSGDRTAIRLVLTLFGEKIPIEI